MRGMSVGGSSYGPEPTSISGIASRRIRLTTPNSGLKIPPPGVSGGGNSAREGERPHEMASRCDRHACDRGYRFPGPGVRNRRRADPGGRQPDAPVGSRRRLRLAERGCRAVSGPAGRCNSTRSHRPVERVRHSTEHHETRRIPGNGNRCRNCGRRGGVLVDLASHPSRAERARARFSQARPGNPPAVQRRVCGPVPAGVQRAPERRQRARRRREGLGVPWLESRLRLLVVGEGHDRRRRPRALGGRSVVQGCRQRRPGPRLVGFATHKSGVVPAYETTYAGNGNEAAYRHVVDARTGRVLVRQNILENVAQQADALVPQPPFAGEVPAQDGACGPRHGPYTVTTPITAIIAFAEDAPTVDNDIVLNIYRGTTQVAAADTGTSPETARYSPTGGVPPADYFVEVCDFSDGAPWADPRTYTGTVTFDDAPPFPYPPRWKVYPTSPPLYTLPSDPWNIPDADARKTWCWDSVLVDVPVPGCEYEVKNLASRAPWDHDVEMNVPTNTTIGNNATTRERWIAQAPGGTNFRPLNTNRNYTFPWTNAWDVQDCPATGGVGTGGIPTVLIPGVSLDIAAAVTNLFVAHNRMHDWAYFLGHTEETWNAQTSNFGLTNPQSENDPVEGRAQAGAIVPGSRNNANMATFPDGQSPVTNMFLWQPAQASFDPPCADGDYDMQIIGHEFTHMIENRLIGKGGTRQQFHAGSMGESVADLFGMEYVNEFNFVPASDENRY